MLLGLDVLRRSKNSPLRRRLAESRFAVLTHAAAVDELGEHCLEVLRELDLAPSLVLSPEHGLHGIAQAEEAVAEPATTSSGVRLLGLYGKNKESLAPTAEDFAGIDLLLIDLVDVGSRYYTYVWTALMAARVAIQAGLHVVVLDRPNPITGNPDRIEGRPQDADFLSFVGLEPIPIRHSLTIGELLLSQLRKEGVSVGPNGSFSVLATQGWERYRLGLGCPFVPPSPNMPSVETALVYPGGCLLEGTNLSEGRGTTRPFETLGAPFLDGEEWRRAVGRVDGALLRPVQFRPTFDKHQGQVCGGLMVHVTDPNRFAPVATYLRLLCAARDLAPSEFRLLDRVYEFESTRRAFDLLCGTKSAGLLLEGGSDADRLIDLVCPVDPTYREHVTNIEAELEAALA